ncbi:aldo/keto reductase [Stutzerimonas stutzeri]|uniref:NADP-dependent oxidoreductase domain-containing protein n=1 Tax=Stutzerimonas stutzeri TaxID=316 RepID=A0A2N8S671_STUST|nr:hypothetical protein CXK92_01200 [Stutzerimonas stutzeri]
MAGVAKAWCRSQPPLASGVLAGRYDEGIPAGTRLTTEGFSWLEEFVFENKRDERIAAAKQLKAIANDLGATRAQLALAWVLQNQAVTSVLVGASSVAQLQENLGALELVPRVDAAVLQKMHKIFEHH